MAPHRRLKSLTSKELLLLLILALIIQALYATLTTPPAFGGTYWKYDADELLEAVTVSGDGNYIVAGAEFSMKIFLFSSNGSLLWTYDQFPQDLMFMHFAVSDDGNRIVVTLNEYTTGEPDTYLFNQNGNIVWQKDLLEGGTAFDVAISADAKYIVAGASGDSVDFFDIDGNLIWNYTVGDWVESVSTSAEGEFTAAGSFDNSLYFFNKTGSLLWTHGFNNSVDMVSVSPDGEYVAAASGGSNELLLLDKNGNILLETMFYNDLLEVSISSNAERIAVCGDSKNVTVIDKTGNTKCEWKTDTDVDDIAITADGRFITFVNGYYLNYLEVLSPSKIKCYVSPDVSFLGNPVTVSGSLNPPVGGAQITLEYILYYQNSTSNPDDFYKETRTVSTIADGSYTDEFTPNDTGKWKVTASWTGGTEHSPTQTETLFAVNPADEIDLSSTVPRTLYWQRDEWYCEERFPVSPPVLEPHFLLESEAPTSDTAAIAAFNPLMYIWVGNPGYDYYGVHTRPLAEDIQIESGLWNLSIWAAAHRSNQSFPVELCCWDKNHDDYAIAYGGSGSFNTTDSDTPREFIFNFNLSTQILPEGSCLGFMIDVTRNTGVTWFFDSTVYPSCLTLPPAAKFVDNVPPEIGTPSREPAQKVTPDQNVTITVTVTEAGLGIRNVTLWYNFNNETAWIPVDMLNIYGDTYRAKIQGYENGTNVRYRITAYDNAENYAMQDNEGNYYSYQVIPEFSTTISICLLFLFSGAILLMKTLRRLKKTTRQKQTEFI